VSDTGKISAFRSRLAKSVEHEIGVDIDDGVRVPRVLPQEIETQLVFGV
jgi:hypothetical protein